MGKYVAYKEYKVVDVPWLCEIPKHWDIRRLGALYTRTKCTGFVDEELLSVYRDYGVIQKSSRDDNFNKPSDDLTPYQLVKPGDLVLNKMKTWQGSIAVSELRGIVSPAYFTYKPNKGIYKSVLISKFAHYLMRSPIYIAEYLRLSKGIRVNQWDLDPDNFKTTPLLLPPIVEQRNISAFLDHETAKIDRLIAKQERLIELLKEKLQAVISHAVTKGLNHDAPMKGSGVEWLGEIPVHWSVVRVKYLGRLKAGYAFKSGDFCLEGAKVLKIANVHQDYFDWTDQSYLPEEYYQEYREFLVPNGAIVFALTRPIISTGVKAATFYSDDKYLLNQRVGFFSPNTMVNNDYLDNVIFSKSFENAFANQVTVTNQPNISPEGIGNIAIALPPQDEQVQIALSLQKLKHQTKVLIDKAEQAIYLMNEHRTALISAAVTGKIDVRDWKKPSIDPEEAATAVSA